MNYGLAFNEKPEWGKKIVDYKKQNVHISKEEINQWLRQNMWIAIQLLLPYWSHIDLLQWGADKCWQCLSGNISTFYEAILNFYVWKLKSLKRQSYWFQANKNRSSRLEIITSRRECLKNEMGKTHSWNILRGWLLMFIRQNLSHF